jgi:hypothetical protein
MKNQKHIEALTFLLKQSGADLAQAKMTCMMLHDSAEALEEMIVFLRDKPNLLQITEKLLYLHKEYCENRYGEL